MPSNLPSLVQRVTRRRYEVKKTGIDALFEFDYMGSSEFEFNALPRALKRMRADKPEVVIQVAAGKPLKSSTAWMVGKPIAGEIARAFFVDQLKPREERQGRTKEVTYLRETYFPEPRHVINVDGWWPLDDDLPPFILFKQKEHAEAWLGAL